MPQEQFTHEEIARMRQIIAQHDSGSNPITTIDLNNPPRQPYKFQPFPKLVYQSNKALKVHTQIQLDEALAEGWSEDASLYHDVQDDSLKPAYQMEVERAEAQLAEARAKRGPGRPRKSEIED